MASTSLAGPSRPHEPMSSSASIAISTATPPGTRKLTDSDVEEQGDSSSSSQSQSQSPPQGAAPQPTQSFLLSSYFTAGAVAGAASRTSVAPLERLKIIYQCQGKSHAYGGVLSALGKIWREEGIKGMFRGNGINCLRIMPYSAVQFASYEQFKKLFTQNGTVPLETPLRLTAGALAGICSVCSTYPLDLVRSRLSIVTASIGTTATVSSGLSGTATAELVQQRQLGVLGMTAKVFREEGGLRGLYRGIGPTAFGVAPYVGLNFTFYEIFKVHFTPSDRPPSIVRKLACGATAGALSQTLTYPLDVLRRKMQVTGMKDKVDFKYNNSFDAIKTIVRSEGVRGLYTGLSVNLLKVAPSIGISFVSYEAAKQWLGA